MNDSRFFFKVGTFVACGLALAVLLVLNFSHGVTLGKSSYHVHVIMPTVAGLKPAAEVQMAGIPIGTVRHVTLDLEGHQVDIDVAILSKYEIHTNATFHIDSQGFLGDQYVEVTPAEESPEESARVPLLKEGDRIMGEAPFNMQEAVRSVAGLLDQARKAMVDVDLAITNINRTLFSPDSLNRFGSAMSNFEGVTASISDSATQVHGILESDAPPLHAAITNFVTFSTNLNTVTTELGQTITTNNADLGVALDNLRQASESLREIADGLQAGKGLAGSLLKDEKMKAEVEALVTNANATAEQFNVFGRRLNQRGLWAVIRKPKPDETNDAVK